MILKRTFGLILAATLASFLILHTAWPTSAQAAMADQGLIKLTSQFGVAETSDRLADQLADSPLTVFARIDHAENAASVDKELRDTVLFIFGNPNVGTPLMQCNQSVAIDLPQKMLIWEDAAGEVFLAYNDPQYLLERHRLEGCEATLERVSQVLSGLATQSTHAD
jgi:uncharacterized protein (DUF302 family)